MPVQPMYAKGPSLQILQPDHGVVSAPVDASSAHDWKIINQSLTNDRPIVLSTNRRQNISKSSRIVAAAQKRRTQMYKSGRTWPPARDYADRSAIRRSLLNRNSQRQRKRIVPRSPMPDNMPDNMLDNPRHRRKRISIGHRQHVTHVVTAGRTGGHPQSRA